jgi:gas vesicle protein
MKSKPSLVILSALLIWMGTSVVSLHAGTVEDIKEGSKQTAREVRDGAVEAGKEIKDGSQKAWKEVKEGVKEVGKEFKKGYQETRDAIRKEVSGEKPPAEKTNKTPK